MTFMLEYKVSISNVCSEIVVLLCSKSDYLSLSVPTWSGLVSLTSFLSGICAHVRAQKYYYVLARYVHTYCWGL